MDRPDDIMQISPTTEPLEAWYEEDTGRVAYPVIGMYVTRIGNVGLLTLEPNGSVEFIGQGLGGSNLIEVRRR